jgi:hypothetical protein
MLNDWSDNNPASTPEASPSANIDSPAREAAADLRRSVAEDYASDRIDWDTARALIASAEFCERTSSSIPSTGTVSLWGFGDAPTIFEPEDGHGFWTALHYLMEPTGCDYRTLRAEYDSDTADKWPGVERLTWVDASGKRRTLEVVNHQFSMRILAGVSPWSSEFNTNMQATFRRAFVGSGLAEHLGNATVVDEDGTTMQVPMADLFTGGGELPSEEEATAQAFHGPAGAL